MKTKKVPEIRLEGFKGDWKSAKFGDIFSEYTEKGHAELPALTIIQGKGTIRRDDSDRNMQYDENSLSGYKMVKKDDFILHLRSFEGGLEKANTDGILSPAYHTFHAEGIDVNFYYLFLRSPDFINILLAPHIYGIRDGKSIDIEGMKTIMLPVPSLSEQKAIGEYFSHLDALITNAEERHVKLLALKKSLLQKMFPQEGERTPRIRFEGFEDEWERVKFGDIVTIFEDKVETPTNGYFRLGIRSWAKGTFHTYVSAGEELTTAQMHRVSADKFIVNITFAWEHAVAITDENDAGKLVSHRFPQFSFQNENKPKFFRYIISSEQFRQYLALSSPGGAGRNRVLDINEMLRYELRIPLPKEQQKIADYFDNLDTLIDVQKQKIAKLKQMKSALLQKMFV